jgi:hypothetical protein
MQGYKNLLKLHIPSKTITNSFLVMNRQIYRLTRKGTSSLPMQRNRQAVFVLNVARWRTPCTSCLNVRGALNLYGSWSERQSLHKHTRFMHIVQYITFMMVRFHGSMPARLHGCKKLKGFDLLQIQKVHG